MTSFFFIKSQNWLSKSGLYVRFAQFNMWLRNFSIGLWI